MDSLNNIKRMLTSEFEVKNVGKLRHFLDIDSNITNGLIQLSYEKYAKKILERFDMSDCNPRTTPCEQKLNFINSNTDGLADPRKYHEAIGSLIYLMTYTWSDLIYIIGKLLQYLPESHEEHLIKAKHILRHIKSVGWAKRKKNK